MYFINLRRREYFSELFFANTIHVWLETYIHSRKVTSSSSTRLNAFPFADEILRTLNDRIKIISCVLNSYDTFKTIPF